MDFDNLWCFNQHFNQKLVKSIRFYSKMDKFNQISTSSFNLNPISTIDFELDRYQRSKLESELELTMTNRFGMANRLSLVHIGTFWHKIRMSEILTFVYSVFRHKILSLTTYLNIGCEIKHFLSEIQTKLSIFQMYVLKSNILKPNSSLFSEIHQSRCR